MVSVVVRVKRKSRIVPIRTSPKKKSGGVSITVVAKPTRRTPTRTSTHFSAPLPVDIPQTPVFIAQPGQIISPAKELAKRFRRGSGRTISVQQEVRTFGERSFDRAGRRVTASGRFRGREK